MSWQQRPGPASGRGAAWIPPGTETLAAELWAAAGHHPVGHPDGTRLLDAMLWAPIDLEPGWPTPTPALAFADGWVQREIIDDDLACFEALAEGGQAIGPEALANAAQTMRLPVCPYRRLPVDRNIDTGSDTDITTGSDTGHDTAATLSIYPEAPADPAAAEGKLIIDLTTHWAGPQATALLADAGATVIKIDPRRRPDGFGSRPRLYRRLNGNKQIIDLDLDPNGDRGADRRRFESLVARADLVVESFSRRVMGNLGYSPAELRRLNPAIGLLSIKAFPAGCAEQDWLAFGPGVHAISGLALADPDPGGRPDVGSQGTGGQPTGAEGIGGQATGGLETGAGVTDRPEPGSGGACGPQTRRQASAGRRTAQSGAARPRTASVAYADPLTGLAAYGAALRLLVDDHRGRSDAERRERTAEVSLRATVQPLVERAVMAAAGGADGPPLRSAQHRKPTR